MNVNITCDCPDGNNQNYPKWSIPDLITWKTTFLGQFYLEYYKDGYIVFHKEKIKSSAAKYGIPANLLASVAWIEAGGKPDWVKTDIVLPIRMTYYNRFFPITKPPETTSVGIIAMQIRVVAETIGINPNELTQEKIFQIVSCMQKDAYNIDIVAKHLKNLILFDYPNANTSNLTDEQFIVAGSRYNRGKSRALKDFISSIKSSEGSPERVYTSYGRVMLKRRDRIDRLLRK